MNEHDEPNSKRKIWIRGFFMLLMAMVYQLTGTVMFIVMLIQFVLALLDTPNDRLVSLGRSLGRYLQQIVNFLTFATEETPFPFSDWPSGE
jgi:Domain of unknown function (DUF4389)